MLLLRDCSGSVHLLLRNAVGGYKEFNYVGMGRVACFGLGTRFIKPDEINTSSFSIRMSFIIFVRTMVKCLACITPTLFIVCVKSLLKIGNHFLLKYFKFNFDYVCKYIHNYFSCIVAIVFVK